MSLNHNTSILTNEPNCMSSSYTTFKDTRNPSSQQTNQFTPQICDTMTSINVQPTSNSPNDSVFQMFGKTVFPTSNSVRPIETQVNMTTQMESTVSTTSLSLVESWQNPTPPSLVSTSSETDFEENDFDDYFMRYKMTRKQSLNFGESISSQCVDDESIVQKTATGKPCLMVADSPDFLWTFNCDMYNCLHYQHDNIPYVSSNSSYTSRSRNCSIDPDLHLIEPSTHFEGNNNQPEITTRNEFQLEQDLTSQSLAGGLPTKQQPSIVKYTDHKIEPKLKSYSPTNHNDNTLPFNSQLYNRPAVVDSTNLVQSRSFRDQIVCRSGRSDEYNIFGQLGPSDQIDLRPIDEADQLPIMPSNRIHPFQSSDNSIVENLINYRHNPCSDPVTYSSNCIAYETDCPVPIPDHAYNSHNQRIPATTTEIASSSSIGSSYMKDLALFAANFKQRRMKLGITQAEVGQALGQLKLDSFGCLSQSTICRFESLTLSYNNMRLLKPILAIWLANMELKRPSRPANSTALTGSLDQRHVDQSGRRRRTSITEPEKRTLEAYFRVQPKPPGSQLSRIAGRINLDKSVVRVWFCNQRQKQKRMQSRQVNR